MIERSLCLCLHVCDSSFISDRNESHMPQLNQLIREIQEMSKLNTVGQRLANSITRLSKRRARGVSSLCFVHGKTTVSVGLGNIRNSRGTGARYTYIL